MRRKVVLWCGEANVQPGLLDHEAVHCFTNGQCHALALAIHQRTGWPLVQAGWNEADYPDHWLVRHPSGQLLDIVGLQSEEEVCERWGKVWEGSVTALDRVWNDPASGYWEPLMGNAESFVDVVLSTYVNG